RVLRKEARMSPFRTRSFLVPVLDASLAAVALAVPPAQAAPPTSKGSPVKVWLTDVSADKWVEKQNDVAFQTRQTSNPLTIKVDNSVTYQKVTGFGAALTDSSSWLIDQLSTDGRNALMKKLF